MRLRKTAPSSKANTGIEGFDQITHGGLPRGRRFHLYVAADAYNSALALSNLNAICHAHLPDRHHIEIIDVLTDPKRAHADGILLTPTLVKLGPAPVRRIVGPLNQVEIVLRALGLETVAA